MLNIISKTATLAAAATMIIAASYGVADAGTSPHSSSRAVILAPIRSVVRGSSVTRNGVTRGSITAVSVFQIPGEPRYAATRVLPDDSSANCAIDSSGSFKSCLTQNYMTCNKPGDAYPIIDLLSYVQRWTRLDPSGLVQQEAPAGIRAGVVGGYDSYCGSSANLTTEQTKTISDPGVSVNYTFKPSWVGKYVQVNDQSLYQCGNSYLTIQRYSEKWTLNTPDVCQGTFGFE